MSDYSIIVPALCDNGIYDNEMRIERKCALLFLALYLASFFRAALSETIGKMGNKFPRDTIYLS